MYHLKKELRNKKQTNACVNVTWVYSRRCASSWTQAVTHSSNFKYLSCVNLVLKNCTISSTAFGINNPAQWGCNKKNTAPEMHLQYYSFAFFSSISCPKATAGVVVAGWWQVPRNQPQYTKLVQKGAEILHLLYKRCKCTCV